MRIISNVAGSSNTSGHGFGVKFGASIAISASLEQKLKQATEARGLAQAGEYVLQSTERQFDSEGSFKLGRQWQPLSNRRIQERMAKLGGWDKMVARGNRKAKRLGSSKSGVELALNSIPILTDTKRLRRSVTKRGGENVWHMQGDTLIIGSRVRGVVNQRGRMATNLPARPFFFLTRNDKRIIRSIILKEALGHD